MRFCSQKKVACEEYFLVQLYQSYRGIILIPVHYIRISLSGLDFRFWNILTPHLLCDFNVLDFHCIVLDLVSENHLLVVLRWRIDECSIDITSNLRTLGLSCCKTFFFIWDSVLKKKLFIPWIEIVQTALIHSELNVGFPLRLSMDDEHNLVAPVGDKVLETQVGQGCDIGDGVFTKPHTIVVAIHHCLVGHFPRAAIALQWHFHFWLSCILQ